MLYFDEEEAPNRHDDSKPFVYYTGEDLYVVQVNWKRPTDGILASDYNENNRGHADRVGFVLRRIHNARLEFLNDVDRRVPDLPAVLQSDHILIDGKIHYKSTDVKTGVDTMDELIEFLAGRFTNTIGCEIGMNNDCNKILLNNDVYERELCDEEIVQFLPCLSYQKRMTAIIQDSLTVCDYGKLQYLLRHGVLFCKT